MRRGGGVAVWNYGGGAEDALVKRRKRAQGTNRAQVKDVKRHGRPALVAKLMWNAAEENYDGGAEKTTTSRRKRAWGPTPEDDEL